MEDQEIIARLSEGINKFLDSDAWLLDNDLSERSMAHKLGMYLQELFSEYNVDCEYNGDVDRPNSKKSIDLLKSRLAEFGLLRLREEENVDVEFANRAVYPDIIIHRRGENKNNLCIIEIKKSSSIVSDQFDQLKLEAYTNNEGINTLTYNLGVFLHLKTGVQYEEPRHILRFYKHGVEIN